MHPWADVAVLAKAKNLEGGFVARSAAGLPFLLEEDAEVAFVPPVLDAPRRATVVEARPYGDAWYVRFAEVSDRSTAEALAGCHCLIRRDSVPDEVWALSGAGLAGWRVVDERAGFSGVVVAVVENPAQTLLEVRRNAAESAGADELAGSDESAETGESAQPADSVDSVESAGSSGSADSASSVYIPLVDEFIAGIDEQASTINLCAPSGLYDL